MLSLPLVALPLLLVTSKGRKIDLLLFLAEGVGAIFVGIFLSAYLAGIPTTTVYHSDPIVRMSLSITGIMFLVLILLTVIIAVIKRIKVSADLVEKVFLFFLLKENYN